MRLENIKVVTHKVEGTDSEVSASNLSSTTSFDNDEAGIRSIMRASSDRGAAEVVGLSLNDLHCDFFLPRGQRLNDPSGPSPTSRGPETRRPFTTNSSSTEARQRITPPLSPTNFSGSQDSSFHCNFLLHRGSKSKLILTSQPTWVPSWVP